MRRLVSKANRPVCAFVAGCTAAALACAAGLSVVVDGPATAPARLPQLVTTSFALANGMRVVVHEDHRVPKVKVSTTVGVGSADEPPGRGGFAHLFEHLMFMGTAAAPNYDVVLEQVGGESNAYTDYDETVFYESAPAGALPTLLWLDADRLANLPAAMTRAKVALQRDVVLNELRQNVLDTPGAGAVEAVGDGLFPPRHPYQRSVIGSIPDLKGAGVADVADFFTKYYRPSNLTMIIAGDVDAHETQRLVSSLFSSIADRDGPPHTTSPSAADPPRCHPCRTEQAFIDAVANPTVALVWAASNRGRSGSIADADLELAAAMLDDTYGNRMQKRLVREAHLATSIDVSYDPKELAGFFTVRAEAAPGVRPDALRRALETQLRTIAEQGFEAAELASAKRRERTALAETLEEVTGRADLLQAVVTRYGSASKVNVTTYQRRFDTRTLASVQRGFAHMLSTAPRVEQTVLAGARGSYPAVLTRSSGTPTGTLRKPPDAHAITRPDDRKRPAVRVPSPETRTLANGIQLTYFERPDAPRTRIVLRIRGGSERDPIGKEGRAGLLSALMTRGAGARDAQALTHALALAGADVSVDVGPGSYSVSMSAPVLTSEASLSILSDVVQRPRLEPDEAGLLLREVNASLDAARQDPGEMAFRATAALYPAGHARARYGTLASYRAVTAGDLRAEHLAVFQPQNTEMIAAGALPIDDLAGQLDRALAGWTNNGQPTTALADPVPAQDHPRTLLVHVPGASQTTLIYVGTTLAPTDPTRAAAATASLVLGGTFTSRLNAKLREEKGYTYGAGSHLAFRRSYGLLVASTSVEVSVTGRAIADLLAEIRRFGSGDITSPETRTATAAAYESSLELVSTSYALVGTYADRRDLGLPWNTLGDELTESGRFATATLNDGARRLLAGQNPLLVIAGDLEHVRPQLKGRDLGEVSEVKPIV